MKANDRAPDERSDRTKGPDEDGAPRDELEPTLAGDLTPREVLAGRTFAVDLTVASSETAAATDASAMTLRAPPVIPGYEICAELGRGAMGVVYLAIESRLHRYCALKMILAGAHADAEAAIRFLGEAEAVAKLQHPNVVQIHHIGEADGLPFFELEYVRGGSLDKRLDGAPWPAKQAARLVEPMARAVAAAHSIGLVHRDLKPANILLDVGETPKITDFGLAKSLNIDSGLTGTGAILGSPSYMAPEQAEGNAREVGALADVYSLGAILYELATGRPPFRGSSVLQTLSQVKTAEPVRPSRLAPGLPRDLETIALRCLEKDPSRRFPSAQALADDLKRFLDGEPIHARPVPFWERGWKWARRRPAIAALVVALHAAGAAFLVLGVVSYVQINRALDAAREDRSVALAARAQEVTARTKAEEAQKTALSETYRASLSEVRALRAARPPGWRDNALASVARLARWPSSRRDLSELRTEAAADLGAPDVRVVARIEGLPGPVAALDFSPDSRNLATILHGGRVHLWDVAARRHSAAVEDANATAEMQSRNEMAVQFMADGRLVYTTAGHRVAFLDPTGSRATRTPIDGQGAKPVGLGVDRRGRWVAVGWSDGRIDLHDADGRDSAPGSPRRLVRDSPNPQALALSPDGRWVALVGANNAVELRTTDEKARTEVSRLQLREENGTEVSRLPLQEGAQPITLGRTRAPVVALAFSNDGQTLAGASYDHTTTLWDVAKREERLTLRGHRETVTDVAFSPDGEWVATSSTDHTARLWDARTGQTLAVLPGAWFMRGVAFSPDGNYLATGCESGTSSVTVYELMGRQEQRRLVGHNSGAQVTAFHPRLARLATGADDRDIIVWDPDAGRSLRRWSGHGSYVSALAYSPDGSVLATGRGGGGEMDRSIHLWNAETGELRQRLPGQVAGVSALAFDPKGRWLATGDENGSVVVWDIADGRALRRVSLGEWVRSVTFLDDRRVLAGAGVGGGQVALFEVEGGAAPRRAALRGGWGRLAVDRRRGRVIVAHYNGDLSTLSLPELTPGHRLVKAHDGIIWSLALRPDGGLLATGGADRRVVLRDAETFAPLLTFPEWTGIIKSISFDSSGTRLAIAGVDSDVAVWDLGLLHDELARLQLAWDQPAPTVASISDLADTEARTRPPAPILRPGNIDAIAVDQARAHLNSGVAAFRIGQWSDAIRDLEQSRDHLRPLVRAAPRDARLVGWLGMSLGFLGAALRESGRPAQSLEPWRESRAVLESLVDPQPLELYNLACSYAQLSVLVQYDPSPPTAADHERLADRAVEILRRALDAGPQVGFDPNSDRDLDPLRARVDFRALMMDRGFPRDPFAAPSPLVAREASRLVTTESYVGIGITSEAVPDGMKVTRILPGGPTERDGRLHVGDTILGVEPDTAFAGKSPSEIGQLLRGAAGSTVRMIVRPRKSDRRVTYELTRGLVAMSPDNPPDERIANRPDDAELRIERGRSHARRSEWQAALDDYRKAIELDPENHTTWYHATPLFLQVGDLAGYRRHCRALIDRYEKTDAAEIAERTAKACSLAPNPSIDAARSLALAARSVALGANLPALPWFRLAHGMAEYRTGEFTPATTTLAAVLAAPGDPYRDTLAGFFLAMAHQRLGNAGLARTQYDRAVALLKTTPPADSRDLGGGWPDWLASQLARREAAAALGIAGD
jgi:eukaryotic-like serine/threonine-protein kinase